MTPRRITYTLHDDSPAPEPGDALVSSRSAYVVLKARIVRAQDGARRFALDVIRLDAKTDAEGKKIYTLKWDRRERKHRH